MRALYGSVLRAARRSAGLRQEQLAEFMGTVQGNVSDIERGKHFGPEPTPELAAHLGTDYGQLLAAWKLSQPLQINLRSEDRAGRRFWFHHVAQREGLEMSLEEFDALMVAHVDEHHLSNGRKR